MPRLLIADGSSQIHRTYHALARMGQNLTAPDGTPTGAVLSFLNVLRKAVRDHAPTHLAVTFDKSRTSFRTRLFPAYKQQRDATADELIVQLGLAREALAALDIPLLEMDDYEADDVIATLVERAVAQGFEVVIFTSDKDLMQLVRPGVVLHHALRNEVMDDAAVTEYFGVPPQRVGDVLAIMGDTSDNVPGVKGIGEKGATLLVQRYGAIEDILAKLPEIEADESLGRTRKRMASLLKEHADDARLARRLVSLANDAPVTIGLDELALRQPRPEPTRTLFQRLGFTKLLADLQLGAPDAAPQAPAVAATRLEAVIGPDARAWDALAKDAAASGTLAIALAVIDQTPEGELPLGEPQRTLGLSAREGRAIALAMPPSPADAARLSKILGDASLVKTGHDLKPVLRALRGSGVEVAGPLFDASLAAGLLEWGRWRGLGPLASDVLGEAWDPGAGPLAAAAHAHAVLRLHAPLRARIDEAGLARVLDEIEAPLVPVIVAMEDAGIRIDPVALHEMRGTLQARLDELTAECHRLAGREFNVGSPKQLGEILFGELQLAPRGKTATGALSTAVDVLDQLVGEHPIVQHVLDHREIAKLLGTYVEVLPKLVDPRTRRVHATFHQLGAETGRISCTDPNLQNIPIRSELGRAIRKAFVAEEGNLLVSADYSQVELRIMAHVSGDDALCEAFAHGEDVHRATAAKMYGVHPELVTSEMRSRAKVINFGLIYGMTAHGVATRLGCTRSEAQALVDGYFGAYPRMKDAVARLIAQVRDDPRHEARTLFGRARSLPEIVSKNGARRSFSERAAVNTVIQGTAADIMKLAMVRVHERLVRDFPGSRLLLQVHDELVIESPAKDADAVLAMTCAEMRAVHDLRAPLLAVGATGRTWDLK